MGHAEQTMSYQYVVRRGQHLRILTLGLLFGTGLRFLVNGVGESGQIVLMFFIAFSAGLSSLYSP